MTVAWEESPDGDFKNYKVLYSTTEGGDKDTVATYTDKMITSHNITDFDPLIENWFWVQVTDTLGLSSIGTGMSNEINSEPVAVNVTSVTYDTTQMTITWSESPDSDFKHYNLLYSATENGDRTSVTTITDISTTSYSVTDFDANVENWYWVEVSDVWGLTSTGTGMTNALNNVPDPVHVTSVTYDLESMTITWEEYVPNMGRIQQMNQNTRSTVTNDFVSYELLQSDSEDGTYTSVIIITDQSTTSHSLTEYDPLVENWFKVKVTDFWNLTSTGTGMTNAIDTEPSPVHVASVTYDFESMTITWDEDVVNTDFLSYELLQSDSEDGTYTSVTVITDQSTISYSLTEFDPSQKNWFKVKVTDYWGLNSIGYGNANVIESPPTRIDISSVTYDLTEMVITWEESSDNDFVSYELLQSDSEGGTYTSVVVITDQSTTSYTLTEYDPLQENWFKVKVTDYWGLNSTGNGMTNEIDAVPTAINISSVTYDFTEMVITWEESSDNDFVSYELLQSDSEDGTYTSVTVITDQSTTSHSLTEFDPSQENWFKVKVTDYWGLNSTGTGMTNEIDSPPTASEISVSYENDSFIITWSQNDDYDFRSYTLYESQSYNMSDQIEIFYTENNTETSYTVTGVSENEIRYYQLLIEDFWELQTFSEISERLDIVVDIDGNVYQTVQIGDQVWMAENLRVTHYNNGNAIPYRPNCDGWDWHIIQYGVYVSYDNNSGYVDNYGYLYNWYNTNAPICPENWHIPSVSEWEEMIDTLGGSGIAGGKMKTTGTIEEGDGLWNEPNTGATNESGFSAIPGGSRYHNHPCGYSGMGSSCYFWATDESSVYRAYSYSLSKNNDNIIRGTPNKATGYSLRCIRD